MWRLTPSPDALRRVLAVYLREQPQEIELTRGKHGKPRLAADSARLEFNLSHSGDLALVAVSGTLEVGIDVERMRPRREEAFYWRWACREARLKCLGIGLLRAREEPPEEPVAIRPLAVARGYAAAVAARSAELPPLLGWTFADGR
ncbi:MAG TPA: hypothetical protein VJU14_12580 [Solirubrobacterales bacterium]|nr:hypothetical protein [Solirubrobacterales bacterium]